MQLKSSPYQLAILVSQFGEEHVVDRIPALAQGLRFKHLSGGNQLSYASELLAKAKAAGADCIVLANEKLLHVVLAAQADYIPPERNKAPTLDAYAGSILYLGQEGLPVLVLPSLLQLVTNPEASFIVARFLAKLAAPQKYLPRIPFSWTQIESSGPKFQEAKEFLSSCDVIAMDIETFMDDPERRIKMIGYCGYRTIDKACKTFVLLINDIADVYAMRQLNLLKPPKIFQNGRYDNVYLLRYGAPCFNYLYDTFHLFHSWYSELPKSLDFITAFCVRDIRYWKEDGKSSDQQRVLQYNAQDCWSTLCSFLYLVSAVPDWAVRNYQQEFPLVFPCITCELEGALVDREVFDKAQEQMQTELDAELASLRYILSAPDFNPGSPKQVATLFQVLGVDKVATAYDPKTGTSKVSTKDSAMLKAKAASPFADVILTRVTSYREKAKSLSTYFQEEKIWLGRLFWQTDPGGTDTGRLASKRSSFWTGLQIQNIDPKLKPAIIADPGWLLGENDKKQSEARCVAYISGEERMIQVVEGPHDYHSVNAEAFFGIPYAQIYDDAKGKTLNKALRDLSKRTNHGANYNMGPPTLLDTMGPREVAKAKVLLKLPASWTLLQVCAHLLNVYVKTYPRVKKDYVQWITKVVDDIGYYTGPTGWTRKFFAKPKNRGKRAVNMAVAHAPQSLSVMLVNQEFYKVWWEQMYGSLQGLLRIKAQIHDSIFYQYKATNPEVPAKVQALMSSSVPVTDIFGKTRQFTIPTDISAGKPRWSELK